MASVDGLAGVVAGWAALLVGGYLAVGLAAATLARRRAAVGRCAERVLQLYPRIVRTALRSVVVATIGVGAAMPALPALATTATDARAPRPPVLAPTRPAVEPLDWPTRPATIPAPRPAHRLAGARVTVLPGECLWSLAAREIGPAATTSQVAAAWPRWWSANRDVIGADPDLLRPGVRLRVPTSTERSAS